MQFCCGMYTSGATNRVRLLKSKGLTISNCDYCVSVKKYFKIFLLQINVTLFA